MYAIQPVPSNDNAILRAVTQIATEVLRNRRWEENITEILGRLGRAARVCRVCVFANVTLPDGRPGVQLRYEWLAPHSPPSLIDLGAWQREHPYPWDEGLFARWAPLLQQGEVIHGPVDLFPPKERNALKSRGIQSLAVVPIFQGERWWGFLGLDECTTPRLWSDEELDVLRSASSILGAALERQHMLSHVETRALEIEILSQVLRALNATPHIDEAFPKIVAPLRQLTRADRISLAMFTPDRSEFIIISLDQPHPELGKGSRMPVEDTSSLDDILNGRIHMTPDLAKEKERPGEQLLYGAGYRSRLNIPLNVQDRVYGALNFAWKRPYGFEGLSIPVLQRLADAIALAIERTHHLVEEQERRYEMERLFQSAAALTANLELDEVLEHILDYLAELTHYDSATILLVEGDALRVKAMRGFAHPEVYMQRRYPLDDPYFLRMRETGEPILLEDASEDPLFEDWDDHYPIRGWLAVPLIVRDKVLGYLTLESRRVAAFGEKETRLAQVFANHAATAIENARLFQQALRLNRDLEAALQARTTLIHRVSHELRTPLTLILGLAELLQTHPEVQSLSLETRNLLENLVHEARHLRHMVNQVLSLKQVEQEPMRFQAIDVHKWVERVSAGWRILFQKKGQILHVDIDSGVSHIWGDPNFLQQVLDNILDNAYKYTPEGRNIYLSVRPYDGSHVLFQIRDEGIGVPPEEIPHLFEQFYRVERKENYRDKGLGLGLALCKGIVERHGGRIWVESEGENRGMTVYFTVPVDGGRQRLTIDD